ETSGWTPRCGRVLDRGYSCAPPRRPCPTSFSCSPTSSSSLRIFCRTVLLPPSGCMTSGATRPEFGHDARASRRPPNGLHRPAFHIANAPLQLFAPNGFDFRGGRFLQALEEAMRELWPLPFGQCEHLREKPLNGEHQLGITRSLRRRPGSALLPSRTRGERQARARIVRPSLLVDSTLRSRPFQGGRDRRPREREQTAVVEADLPLPQTPYCRHNHTTPE